MNAFQKGFDEFERQMAQRSSAVFRLLVVWLVFCMGAISVGLFILGRWLGVW